MAYITTVFNQLLDFLPRYDFECFVNQYNADKYTKKLSCWQQLICLLYAQATGKESLRDIETSLKVHHRRWYHIGLETVARSTLGDANKRRPHEIFERLFYELLRRCKEVSVKKPFRFDSPVYLLDGSIISLCLSLCPWSKFGQTKGGLKIHNLLSLDRQLPEIMILTEQRVSELEVAESIDWNRFSDSWLIFDRGYYKYGWWNSLNSHDIRFITRLRTNTNYCVLGQLTSEMPKEKDGVIKDERIALFGVVGLEDYPQDLRLITYRDPETKKVYQFITNDFQEVPEMIAQLYKERWQIELFFKWIKQNLIIKSFLGTSKNAVMVQIWVAMIFLLLAAYIKHQTGTELSLLELTRVITSALMSPLTLIDLLQLNPKTASESIARASPRHQLTLC
jgi:hypothetical protein